MDSSDDSEDEEMLSRRMSAPDPSTIRGRGVGIGGGASGGGPGWLLWQQQHGRRRSSSSSGGTGTIGNLTQKLCSNAPSVSAVSSPWQHILSDAVPRPSSSIGGGVVSAADFSFPDLKLPITSPQHVIPTDRGLPLNLTRGHKSEPIEPPVAMMEKGSSDGESDEEDAPFASLISFASCGGRPPVRSHTFDEARLKQLRAHALAESAKLGGSESSDWTRAKAPQLLQPAVHAAAAVSGGHLVQAAGHPPISRRASLVIGSLSCPAVNDGASGQGGPQTAGPRGISRRFSLGPGSCG